MGEIEMVIGKEVVKFKEQTEVVEAVQLIVTMNKEEINKAVEELIDLKVDKLQNLEIEDHKVDVLILNQVLKVTVNQVVQVVAE